MSDIKEQNNILKPKVKEDTKRIGVYVTKPTRRKEPGISAIKPIPNLLYPITTPGLEVFFGELVETWYRETLHSSAYLDKILHPAYQRIIGLGKDVIPLILRELQDEPLEWFWALRALTGEDPTTSEMAGKRNEMAKAWLNWGKENEYI